MPLALLRLATSQDIPTLTAADRACFTYNKVSSKGLEKYLARGDAFVATDNKHRFVGYLLIKRQPKELVLKRIGVLPAYQGQGLGLFLLQWLKEFSHQQDIHRITLHVDETNAPAIRVYQKAGFKIHSRHMNYYEKIRRRFDKKDALKMRLELI